MTNKKMIYGLDIGHQFCGMGRLYGWAISSALKIVAFVFSTLVNRPKCLLEKARNVEGVGRRDVSFAAEGIGKNGSSFICKSAD